MSTHQTQLVAALSTRAEALAQRLDGTPAAHLFERFAGRRLMNLPPRRGELSPLTADLARPVRFPQTGSGSFDIGALPPPETKELRTLVRHARRQNLAIVGHEALTDPWSRISLLILAAAGATVGLSCRTDQIEEVFGRELTALMLEPAPTDARQRELRSIKTRRLAHDALWCGQSDTSPEVSVLLASRRPSDLTTAVRQVRSQIGCEVQLLIGLHGDRWPLDAEDEVAAALPVGSFVKRFDKYRSLGEVLTALTGRADRALVSKWDDDDWYGPSHLADLAQAYRYSGADVVGKAAEFVYLAGHDITMRRFARGAESYSWTLAGGTLLTSKAWLERVGGWPNVRSRVDQALLETTRRVGGHAYRTHGYQYVLQRRPDGDHTWHADAKHFLATATAKRDGLDLGFADIEQKTGPHLQ